jgi:gliding motility-associated-like protein
VDSPTITTTYTVDSDNGTGCIGSQTITVNVSSNPTIIISASPIGTICIGTTATLTASGASTYTWNPGALTGTTITDAPIITTTYTVDGDNGFGCISTNTFVLDVAPGTSITAIANPTTICANTTVSLSAIGANTYTWMPLGTSGSSTTATPSVSLTYTVLGDNGTCIASATVYVDVTPGPANITASASGSLTCIGDVTLTSSSSSTNTLNYSWNGPSSFTATIQSPTTTIVGDYTVTINDALTGCSSTTILTVGSNTTIPGLTATTSGSVECIGSVTITATSTSTDVLNYDWTGPLSFTAAIQSPTTNIAGDYSVTVSDATTGCSSTTTLTVGSNTVIPNLIASTSGSLGCTGTVTITATSTSTNTLSYDWAGPLSFTASVQSPTTSVAGDYTVTVNDALTGCTGTTSLTVGSSTIAPTYTATIIAATCSGTLTNNDGTILLTGFGINDNYDFVQANTYTGTANYATAISIPTTGIITNTLVNPSIATPYAIRVFNANGCFTDATLTLTPTTCSITNINVLGMTKAVSTATYVNNNAYNVTYTIVTINTSTVDLTNFSIIDNLNNTFPLPTTYGIISSPFITSLNSSLTINPTYDGSSQTNMISPLTSTLVAGKRDTIVFTIQINPNGFFGPFNNSAVGFGTDNNSIVVSDSSNTGFDWDPDNDGNPTNNDTATVVILNPNSSIGIAKSGSLSEVLADKTIDITYIFNIKNLGNDTIKLVQVLDDLTISSPAQFTIKTGPTTSSSLTPNSNYNGLSDNALLVAGTSKLVPGAIETITLVINVTPNEITSITNIAIATGIGADGGIVRDTSNAGIEPDPNGNGNATEQGENNPTILELPNVELFIPEVFTPDGDGKNDFFVIKGISGKTVKITVFNRWGNKVYENSAYDNTWNGIPNVSGVIGGNNKLPQGTYYYIAEFEDENNKPINGFVVLQY